ncbi:hypothetical protein N7U66_18810 [Lacinutrix neustonica]|uniref:Uncharacterized protein n=1 Tax=Lacinutrix neustonica TaxID=2980107 RepID=A0A9E8MVU0_9FLAO|nr:hypothetical protein [Lacinutrix neustonica]WAC01885.1 hypothetical protein N7U66_18810 [Lacinutrix neustonica]
MFYITNPSSENYIEFSRSEFSIKKIQDQQNKGEKIGIPDYSSFVNTIDVLPEFTTIACNKLVVNFKETKTDFFKISRVPYISGYFVSERLKNAIEEKGFTGMAFKEIGEIDKRIEVIY